MGLRILHSALLSKLEPGILRQMMSEQAAARKLNLNWSANLFTPSVGEHGLEGKVVRQIPYFGHGYSSKNIIYRVINWFHLRLRYYLELSLMARKYDVILLRHSVADPFQLVFLLFFGRKTMTVHHTLELFELGSLTDRYRALRLWAEKILGFASLRLVSGVVCVTDEILVHQERRSRKKFRYQYIYPNGIDYRSSTVEHQGNVNRANGRCSLLFVASAFHEWQGLDRLLQNLSETSAELTLHLVGMLSKTQLEAALMDSRVVPHGVLSAEQIEALAAISCLGLSAFALDRKHMTEACTLKVREYLENGLPVYAGHRDIFDERFEYFKEGAPIVDEIMKYAAEVRAIPAWEVRERARPYIQKEVLLQKLYSRIQADRNGLADHAR